MAMTLVWAFTCVVLSQLCSLNELLSTELPATTEGGAVERPPPSRTQGRTVGSGTAQVVLVVGCRLMFPHMSCAPAAGTTSQLLPLGQEGCRARHGMCTGNNPRTGLSTA